MAIGDFQIVTEEGPHKGRKLYDLGNGSYGFVEPSPETIAQAKIKRGGSLGGSYGDKKSTEQVKGYQKSTFDDLLLDTAIDVGGDVLSFGAHRAIPKDIKRAGLKRGLNAIRDLAGLAGGYGAGEAASAALGRPDDDVAMRTALSRAMGQGINYGMGKGEKVLNRTIDAFTGPSVTPGGYLKGVADDLIPHPVRVLHQKMLERAVDKAPPTPSQLKNLEDIVEFGENTGSPVITSAGLFSSDPRMVRDIKRSGLATSIQERQGEAVKQLLGTKAADIEGKSNYASAKLVQNTARQYRKQRKAELNQKFNAFDADIEQTAITVPIPIQGTNPATGQPYQSTKIVTITGPVDITPSIQNVEPVRQALDVLESQGNLSSEGTREVSKLRGLFENLTNTPKINDRYIADYKTVKAMRENLDSLIKTIPLANSQRERLSNEARSLQASLSKDTDNAILEPGSAVYSPQVQAKYAEIKEFTKENAAILKSKLALQNAANQNSPNQETGKTRDVNPETLIMNAIKTGRNGLDNLAVMLPPGDRDLAGAIYMKHGLDQALDPKSGMYDSIRLNNFFFGSNGVGAGALESNVFTPHQRKTIKQYIKYMQTHEGSANPTSSGSALENTTIKGAVYLGTGAVGKLMGHTFGAGGAVGGVLAAGIPPTRNFFENVLMDPDGGRKILNYIHAPTPNAKAKNLRDLVEFTIRSGARVVLRDEKGNEVEKN